MNIQANYYDDQVPARQLFSIDSEQNVLGSILIDSTKMPEAELLKPDDFFDRRHQMIFDACLRITESNAALDAVIIAEHFDRRGELAAAGGLDYLIDIARQVASTANIAAHVRIVSDASKERKLVNAAQEIKDAIFEEGDLSTADRLSKAESIFTAASIADESQVNVVDMRSAVKDYIGFLDWRFNNDGPQGVLTGLAEVDARLQGLKPGELYIVAARPGMGKTTYATNILAHAARAGAKAYFSSLEMPRNQLVQRMMASTGNIPLSALKDASALGDSELCSRVTVAAGLVAKMDIFIDDQGGVDIADLRSRCRAKHRKGGLDLILVDYLQLLNDRSAGTRFDVVSAVSRKLKGLAKELSVPIIVLSQLSREVEKRPDKRPILSDLRESGQIEQDADVIQFLYRDEVYNEHSNSKGICEVITAKYRDGEPGKDFVAFIGAQNRMANLAAGFTPEPQKPIKPYKKGF